MREVWNGSELSSASAPPPMPPHLASPTALLNLKIKSSELIYVCKRDARVYFDQLSLPVELRPFVGRPAVRAGDSVKSGGITWQELAATLGGTVPERTLLYSLCTSFPMGFSWSSFVAQTVLLARCCESGLSLAMRLSDDNPCLADLRQTFALATDDVTVFMVGGANAQRPGKAMCARLVRAIKARGIQGAPEKDVNDQLNATVIGIDVCDGQY